jgi:hypothetical protein
VTGLDTGLQPGVEVLPAAGGTAAVVLVLHGGKAASWAPSDLAEAAAGATTLTV